MQVHDTIGYWLAYAQRCFASALFDALQAHCAERGKSYIVTPPQWGVLARLDGSGDQTIGALARWLGVDGPAVTGIVKRLEESGLVERTRSRSDERVVNVSLTHEGQDIVRSLGSVVGALQDQILSPEEQQVFLQELQRLIVRTLAVAPDAGSRFSFVLERMRSKEQE